MRKLITLTMVVSLGLFMSCKKSTPQPTSPQPQNSVTNTNNSNLTGQDSALVGYWILDKKEQYSNGSITNTTNHNDPNNCFLDLKPVAVSTSTVYRQATHSIDCVTVPNGQWRINSNKLELMNGLYSINTLSSNSLIIQIGSTSSPNGAWIYYFHK
jgi:hypothetical protein